MMLLSITVYQQFVLAQGTGQITVWKV